MIVYLSGPTGPVTHPVPDTDPDQDWRTQAKTDLTTDTVHVIDITTVLPSPTPHTGSAERIIDSLISEVDLVLGHAVLNSWQSQFELETADKYNIPILVNVAGPDVNWANDPKFDHWTKHTSMVSTIMAARARIKYSGKSGGEAIIEPEPEQREQREQWEPPISLKVLPHDPDQWHFESPHYDADILPRSHPDEDCGYDLTVLESCAIPADSFFDVDCGVSLELPPGHWGMITGRSSTFRKKGLLVLPGVIDSGYRGRIFTGIFNTNKRAVSVEKGERLSQLILIPMAVFPVEVVPELGKSDRGEKGFGSSGA